MNPYKGNLVYLSKGVKVLEILLSKNFHSRPGCRQKSSARSSGVGGGGHTKSFMSGFSLQILCSLGESRQSPQSSLISKE